MTLSLIKRPMPPPYNILVNGSFRILSQTMGGGNLSAGRAGYCSSDGDHRWTISIEPRFKDESTNKVYVSLNSHVTGDHLLSESEVLDFLNRVWDQVDQVVDRINSKCLTPARFPRLPTISPPSRGATRLFSIENLEEQKTVSPEFRHFVSGPREHETAVSDDQVSRLGESVTWHATEGDQGNLLNIQLNDLVAFPVKVSGYSAANRWMNLLELLCPERVNENTAPVGV